MQRKLRRLIRFHKDAVSFQRQPLTAKSIKYQWLVGKIRDTVNP